MSSVYNKNGIIYISWYDWLTRKNVNRSTGLKDNKDNRKKAAEMARELERKIASNKERYKTLGLQKNTIDEAIRQFLKNNGNKDEKTIYEYNWFFERFTKTFDRSEQCTVITKLKCEEWLVDLRSATYVRNGKEIPYSKNTLHSYTKVLKKFLNFLFEYNYIPVFKLNKDVVHKPEVKQLIVFSKEDLAKLLDGLKDKDSNFKTTFLMLLYTGLRPSDIYNIEVKDIDMEANTFNYYSEKTDEYFQLPIHRELRPILYDRIKEVKEGKLFMYETIGNIGRAFRRYLKKLNLNNKGYTLRTFRKTVVSLMHDSGVDLATVSKLVGHKQITTTEKYYNKLSLQKKSDELNKLKFSNND